jgi:hypothetical protein
MMADFYYEAVQRFEWIKKAELNQQLALGSRTMQSGGGGGRRRIKVYYREFFFRYCLIIKKFKTC